MPQPQSQPIASTSSTNVRKFKGNLAIKSSTNLSLPLPHPIQNMLAHQIVVPIQQIQPNLCPIFAMFAIRHLANPAHWTLIFGKENGTIFGQLLFL
jgi:hypothetical protein